jgi:thymidylate synthase (FAD)
MNNFTDEKVEKFINKLTAIGHESPLEHVSFTFGIEGISRACSHQLVRHRIASYSQKSQRYIEENNFNYVVPPAIADTVYESEYHDMMNKIQSFYHDLRAMGLEPEDARMILPNACCTSIIVTMNVRTLLNFFKHRDCNRAQWEIRSVAREMMKICKEVAPRLFKHAGASCRRGKCSEGEMSCGNPPNKS